MNQLFITLLGLLLLSMFLYSLYLRSKRISLKHHLFVSGFEGFVQFSELQLLIAELKLVLLKNEVSRLKRGLVGQSKKIKVEQYANYQKDLGPAQIT